MRSSTLMERVTLGCWCRAATARTTVRTAVGTALVVGPVLTVINQWQAVTGSAPLDWAKVGLTFVVPYLVATYSAAASRCRDGAPG